MSPTARSLGSRASINLCWVGASYPSYVPGLGFSTLGWGWGWGSPTPASFSQPTSDPDFVVLDDSLHVQATYISGELVWQVEEAKR